MRFTAEELRGLRATVAQGTTDDEFEAFLAACRRYDLDPFQGQIYCTVRTWTKDGEPQRSCRTEPTVDGLRALASRTGAYQGQVGPQWCGAGEGWADLWRGNGNPFAARVGVWRAGFREPLWGVARWSEFADERQTTWRSYPTQMLATAAERVALRRAFPEASAPDMGDDEPLRVELADGRVLDVDAETGEIETSDGGPASSDESPLGRIDADPPSEDTSGGGASTGATPPPESPVAEEIPGSEAATPPSEDGEQTGAGDLAATPASAPPGDMGVPATSEQWDRARAMFGSVENVIRAYCDHKQLDRRQVKREEITRGDLAELMLAKAGAA